MPVTNLPPCYASTESWGLSGLNGIRIPSVSAPDRISWTTESTNFTCFTSLHIRVHRFTIQSLIGNSGRTCDCSADMSLKIGTADSTHGNNGTGDPRHSRAACTQPCNVNTHSRAHCSPGARLCEQWGHGCVNNGARLCASARLCRGSPVNGEHVTKLVAASDRRKMKKVYIGEFDHVNMFFLLILRRNPHKKNK